MSLSILIGAGVALLVGFGSAAQSALVSQAGKVVGNLRTGILTSAVSGLLAALLLGIWLVREGAQSWKLTPQVASLISISGVLGLLILTGVSFSFQRTGIAAGMASVIVGQLVLSNLIDSLGILGTEQIPFTIPRLIGLVFLCLGVYLILPRA